MKSSVRAFIISWVFLIIAIMIGNYLKSDPFGAREKMKEREETELILLLKSYAQEDTVMTRKALAEKIIWKLERD